MLVKLGKVSVKPLKCLARVCLLQTQWVLHLGILANAIPTIKGLAIKSSQIVFSILLNYRTNSHQKKHMVTTVFHLIILRHCFSYSFFQNYSSFTQPQSHHQPTQMIFLFPHLFFSLIILLHPLPPSKPLFFIYLLSL